jgi:DNA-3-methyladenine glycosylase II
MSKRIITHLSRVDVNMGGLIGACGPYRLVAELDCHPFQSLARAITHQQLNGIAAKTILQRFVKSCGDGTFPTPDIVLATPDATLRAAGLSFAKIAALKDLAAKTLEGIVPDRHALTELDDIAIIERLTQVRGIGRWTVEMLLMFQLGRPDVLPVDDFGVRNGFRLAYGLRKMPQPRALAAFGERWAPHRTAAAWYLWRANEMKREGTLPEPVERIRLPRLHRLRKVVRPAKAQAKKARQRPARQ